MQALKKLLHSEAAGGILLGVAAILAMIVANSPLSAWYEAWLNTPVQVRIGALDIDKNLLLWINDGLMAVFFLLVGLELKREMLEGALSNIKNVMLPAIGAVGGMLVPALIYVAFNWGDPVAMNGWAIPAATDIAFALGVLSLLGDRVPVALKVFLVSVAIFDDLGAIIIIALFYTSELSLGSLAVAFAVMPFLWWLNKRGTTAFLPYILLGLIMWVAVLKSGVHATLAGVALAIFIPMRDPKNKEHSPLRDLEHSLHGGVIYFILPVFAFANSGLSFAGVGMDFLLHPVSLGIAAGLFLGKQIGIAIFCWLGVKLGLAALPGDVSWKQLYGAAIICGIGFTMSLFIGSLAFDPVATAGLFDERMGIILGSLLSGLMGYYFLKSVSPAKP